MEKLKKEMKVERMIGVVEILREKWGEFGCLPSFGGLNFIGGCQRWS